MKDAPPHKFHPPSEKYKLVNYCHGLEQRKQWYEELVQEKKILEEKKREERTSSLFKLEEDVNDNTNNINQQSETSGVGKMGGNIMGGFGGMGGVGGMGMMGGVGGMGMMGGVGGMGMMGGVGGMGMMNATGNMMNSMLATHQIFFTGSCNSLSPNPDTGTLSPNPKSNLYSSCGSYSSDLNQNRMLNSTQNADINSSFPIIDLSGV
jgi:hypothetical protein